MSSYPKLLLFSSFITLFCLFIGCGSLSEDSSSGSSTQGSVESVDTDFYPLDSLVRFNSGNAFDPKYSVNQYTLSYYTIDANGNTILASAKLLIPSLNRDLDLIMYNHNGSTTLDSMAPSLTYVDFSSYDPDVGNFEDVTHNLSLHQESVLTTLFASEGYAILMPDYIGFGASSSLLNPYINALSYAYPIIDAIRAAHNFANSNQFSFSLSGDFILTGYSGGGYATMATHKEMLNSSSQYSYTDLDVDNNLKGVIPGAPPCNLSGVMAGLIVSSSNYLIPAYGPYILLSYHEVYHLTDDISSLFAEDYQYLIDDFYDGTVPLTGDGSINTSLASIYGDRTIYPVDIFSTSFKTEVKTAYEDYIEDQSLDSATTTGFFEQIIANDVYNYQHNLGEVYYKILYVPDDKIVPFGNIESASNFMDNVGLIKLEADNHTSGFSSYFFNMRVYAKQWLAE